MQASAKLCILAVAAICVTAILVVVLLEMDGLATAVSRRRVDDDDDDDNDDIRTSPPRVLLRRDDDRFDDSSSNGMFLCPHMESPTKAYRANRFAVRDGKDGCDNDPDALVPVCTPIANDFVWNLHRAAQAVGRLVLEGKGECSGLVLRNTTSFYFLTAAQCMPNEATVTSVRIELTNCLGTKVLTCSRVFHANRQLDILILQLDVGSASVANYGWLVLRTNSHIGNDTVFIPHYKNNQLDKRITAASKSKPIQVDLSPSSVGGCPTTLPSSRIAYVAPSMDKASVGAPLISVVDFAVVGVHVCGDCKTGEVNSAVSFQSILDDLRAHDRLLPEFLT